MGRLQSMRGRSTIEAAGQLASDKSLQKELRSAAGHAAALVRGARRGSARQVLGGLRDGDLQDHALALIGNIDRAIGVVEARGHSRKRHTLLTALVALGIAGVVGIAAKSIEARS